MARRGNLTKNILISLFLIAVLGGAVFLLGSGTLGEIAGQQRIPVDCTSMSDCQSKFSVTVDQLKQIDLQCFGTSCTIVGYTNTVEVPVK